MYKAVFLDKDGTLVKDVPYNVNPDKIELYEDVGESLQQLKQQGFKLVVITNQPGIALGYFEEKALEKVYQKLNDLLAPFQIEFDGFYYCPHFIEGKMESFSIDCDCRKPAPGLIIKAAASLNIDLSKSWMVGDILNDVEAGNKAGCKTVLIDNGGETEWILSPQRNPTYTVKTIKEAVKHILHHQAEGSAIISG